MEQRIISFGIKEQLMVMLLSFGIKEQLMLMLQNVNDVNKRAHPP